MRKPILLRFGVATLVVALVLSFVAVMLPQSVVLAATGTCPGGDTPLSGNANVHTSQLAGLQVVALSATACVKSGHVDQVNVATTFNGSCIKETVYAVINGKGVKGQTPGSGDCSAVLPLNTDFTQANAQITSFLNPLDVTDSSKVATISVTDDAISAGDQNTTATNGTNTDPELDCNWDSSPFAWFMCPMVHILTGAVTTLDGYMNDLLTINTEPIFGKSVKCAKADVGCQTSVQSATAYYSAWQQMRNIALALMVLAGLVMVTAQAFGFELLDAYTVRKVLPRILIVAIGISLSWPIMEFMINLTNDVGGSVREIIYAPFSGINGGVFGLRGGGNTLTAAFVLPGVVALKFGGVFSLVGTALLALGVGFLVMILRQIAITMLVILAPVALVCYILPNTQKVYKIWWESFSKALLMFPLIAGFIAAGRVFAVTASALSKNAPGGLGSVYEVISVIAYIIPYFLLPLTVRFAGGLVGTLGGFANDRSRGLSDRLKNYRKNKIAKNGQDLKNGNYFNGKNRVSQGLSRLGENVAAVQGAGLGPRPKNWRSRLKAQRDTNRAAWKAQTQKSDAYGLIANSEDHAYAAWLMATQGDAAARAHLEKLRTDKLGANGQRIPLPGGGYEQTRKYDNENVENIMAAGRQVQRLAGSNHSFAVAALEARSRIATNNGADSSENWDMQPVVVDGKPQFGEDGKTPLMEKVYIGSANLQLDMAKLAGNDASEAGRLQATIRSSTMQAGRIADGGHSFGDGMAAYFKMRDALQKGDGKVDNQTIINVANDLSASVLRSQNAYTITNQGRKDSLERLIPAMRREARDAMGSGDEKQVARKAAEMASYYENLNATSPEKAKEYADSMMAVKFTVKDAMGNMVEKTGRAIVEEMRKNPIFREVRREYGYTDEEPTSTDPNPPKGPDSSTHPDANRGYS